MFDIFNIYVLGHWKNHEIIYISQYNMIQKIYYIKK